MPKKSSIAVFIAATSALSITATENLSIKAGENDLGGLNAQRLADEAAKSSACVPIGEGENCW